MPSNDISGWYRRPDHSATAEPPHRVVRCVPRGVEDASVGIVTAGDQGTHRCEGGVQGTLNPPAGSDVRQKSEFRRMDVVLGRIQVPPPSRKQPRQQFRQKIQHDHRSSTLVLLSEHDRRVDHQRAGNRRFGQSKILRGGRSFGRYGNDRPGRRGAVPPNCPNDVPQWAGILPTHPLSASRRPGVPPVYVAAEYRQRTRTSCISRWNLLERSTLRPLSMSSVATCPASISIAGSPPRPGPVAEQRWSGSWGRQTPG